MTLSPSRREEAERREHEWLAALACFSDEHGDRPLAEPPDPFRTCFLRDRDRVVHCGAFRRLKNKTQVFVIDEGDFYRTRLTHTLEVAQMARFLALALRLNDGLAEVLALVHDIGHPPFGHEGEAILDQCAGVPFDHNRQALRIVDVIEHPYADRPGLNLTHAVRASILKHGGSAGAGAPDHPGHLLEAQLVDLADSIAYTHHDVEDGIRAGILTDELLSGLPAWSEAAAEVDARTPAARGRSRRKAVLGVMLKTSLYDVVETTAAEMSATDAACADDVARRDLHLVRFSPPRAKAHAELRAFLTTHFYKHPRVLRSAQIAQRSIAAIVEHYRARPEELPPAYRERIEEQGRDRCVCDYVAGMTDRYAIDQARLLGSGRITSPVDDGEGPPAGVAALQDVLGYTFADRELVTTALTHSSARSEEQPPNERLEFLGDSVLGLLVAEALFQRYPDRAEGELSRIKSSVVSRYALRSVADQWNLESLLTVGPGFRDVDVPPSVIADAVEAVLGAVFLDGGLEPVRRLVQRHFGPLIERASDRTRASNHKSELQAFTQGRMGFTPHYSVRAEEGPDHAKTFTVSAVVGGFELAVASGRNKRQAEQAAARDALRRLVAAEEAEDGGDLPDDLSIRLAASAEDDDGRDW